MEDSQDNDFLTVPNSEIKVRRKREKKPATPAQKEAITKALSALKTKREALRKQQEEEEANITEEQRQIKLKEKYEKAKQQKKKLPPAPSYITTEEFRSFKDEILRAMPKEVYKAVEIERKEPVVSKKHVVEEPKVVLPPPQPISVMPPVQKVLTGHDLLDKVFGFTK